MPVIKRVTKGDGSHYGYRFNCPACGEPHVIPTKQGVWDGSYFGSGGPGNGWDFDGNVERPTFSPSIDVQPSRRAYDDMRRRPDGELDSYMTPRCHSFVRAGRIEFLSDCGHALAGQTVDLPELPDA